MLQNHMLVLPREAKDLQFAGGGTDLNRQPD
jgi:hypothetical protein